MSCARRRWCRASFATASAAGSMPRGREIEPLARGRPGAGRRATCARRGVEAVAVVLPARLCQPGARARRPRRCSSSSCPASSSASRPTSSREFREFERASTTVLNAFLTPVMDQLPRRAVGAARATARRASASRRDKPIMVMEASGGLMTVASARAQAGAHGAVGAGRRRRRQRARRRAGRRRTTSSPWISAAPAPTSA